MPPRAGKRAILTIVRGIKIDFATYFKAVPLLLRHPTVIVAPLLAAVVDVLVYQVTPFLTNAVGGAGSGLLVWFVQLVFLWAFGVAIVQASNIWRGRRGTFDEAWEESRSKFSAIALAAFGFSFVVWAATYIGSFINGALGIALGAVAAFFLIYTMPAAAIGGFPGGSIAISASIRTVRANIPASILLALVWVALWIVLPIVLTYLLQGLSPLLFNLIPAAIRALMLGYLAFPFAKQYDDVAFTRFW